MRDDGRLNQLLRRHLPSYDVFQMEFGALARSVRQLDVDAQRALAAASGEVLRLSDVVRSTPRRVVACKILCATAPYSSDRLESWLKVRPSVERYEVQFTLFCFLDGLQRIREYRGVVRRLPKLIEEYLMEVRDATGRAAWMAGHLLGEHWNMRAAVPILTKVARRGRFATGRSAAVMGLGDTLTRGTKGRTRATVLAALRYSIKSDPSSRVRSSARFAFGRLSLRPTRKRAKLAR